MIRIIAKNVKKLLEIRFKGFVTVKSTSYDALIIEIDNGRFVYRGVVYNVTNYMLYEQGSISIADKIGREYRKYIDWNFYK